MNPTAATQPPGEPTTRLLRKRERTAARLLAATRRVVAHHGVAGTTIALVAEEADVAFGTFYNYFPSKEAAIDAVTRQVVEEVRIEVDELLGGMESAVERVAAATTRILLHGAADHEWRAYVTEVGRTDNSVYRTLGLRLVEDLELGSRTGEMEVQDLAAVLVIFGGAIGAAMEALRLGNIEESSVAPFVAHLLRSLGVPADEARAAAEAAGERVSAAASLVGRHDMDPGSAMGKVG